MSETSQIEADVVIDAIGAGCPGPLMDLIGKVKTVDSGTVVELRTSDGGSKDDVPAWVEKAGHELLGMEEYDDHWRIFVEKA